ncbi:hypothetical protein BTM25_05040 [Actinomadura rubteroloni]|uniref:Uncharacterized protein n=1 Tax=Actinomadura rubteroloni TaxID=1926885 RepID=A0A2P4UM43_9ACTN|nr:hypothetical protein [Actinomadura rubteroloni]POM26116.1 hypothetical protein BTM25_05040 [Actinomadura rubteroloni]
MTAPSDPPRRRGRHLDGAALAGGLAAIVAPDLGAARRHARCHACGEDGTRAAAPLRADARHCPSCGAARH